MKSRKEDADGRKEDSSIPAVINRGSVLPVERAAMKMYKDLGYKAKRKKAIRCFHFEIFFKLSTNKAVTGSTRAYILSANALTLFHNTWDTWSCVIEREVDIKYIRV